MRPGTTRGSEPAGAVGGAARRWLAGLAAMAALAATASCAAPSLATDLPGCVVLDHLRVRGVGQVAGALSPSGGLGSSSTYVRRVYDSRGALAATVYGASHVRLRMSDGHLLQTTDERLDFDGGTVQAQGLHDLTALDAGKADYLPTIGTSGVFKDKLGRWTLRRTDEGGASYTAALKMCPAGILK